jgi:SP family sugar:H+ symporter-like MFS transporter
MTLGAYSIKLKGADCGFEAIMLGVITSIGGFLFGYDTVCFTVTVLSSSSG